FAAMAGPASRSNARSSGPWVRSWRGGETQAASSGASSPVIGGDIVGATPRLTATVPGASRPSLGATLPGAAVVGWWASGTIREAYPMAAQVAARTKNRDT